MLLNYFLDLMQATITDLYFRYRAFVERMNQPIPCPVCSAELLEGPSDYVICSACDYSAWY